MKKTHGLSKHPIYSVWHNMNVRCNYKGFPAYKYYGGRGIKICQEWENVLVFYEWAINNGYREGLTIDRINTNGNYTPDNCRFTTMKVQMNNRRPQKIIMGLVIANDLIDSYNDVFEQLKRGGSLNAALKNHRANVKKA